MFQSKSLIQIPKGKITEISGTPGSGKTEMVLKHLAEQPGLRVAWIEDELSIYPYALSLSGIPLDRVLFTEAGKDLIWSTLQILRSRLFGAVVLSTQKTLEQIDLRRLQLAAEQSMASLILLSEKATGYGSWTLSLQIEIKNGCANILRSRNSWNKNAKLG